MSFPYSKIALACALSLSTLLTACAKENKVSEKSDALTATTPATGEASPILERNEKQRLMNTLQENIKKTNLPNINIKVTDIKPTEVPNIYWVSLEGMPSVYATGDGKYIIQGDVVRLGGSQIVNVGEDLQAQDNKALLAGLKTEDLIVYPAKGATKHVIYVFTDATCQYCHKLHEEVPAMNAKGIEVRYAAWPRGEQSLPIMTNIWCSKDRRAALDAAIQGKPVQSETCTNPVMDHYKLGARMGVSGTPAVFSAEGKQLGGYITADELVKRLEK